MNAELSEVQTEVSKMTRQLESANLSRQTQQEEMRKLRHHVEDLEVRKRAMHCCSETTAMHGKPCLFIFSASALE